MNAKHVYFVRHGQSEYNIAEKVLSYDTPLTQLGLLQARECRLRCLNLDFQLIFTSPYQRSRMTAAIINEHKGKPILIDRRFFGYRYPEATIGLEKKNEPSHLEMMSGVEQKYKGGDNYSELQARVAAALTLIEERDEVSILVISHGYFLYTVFNLIVFGSDASFTGFERIYHALPHDNTGLTHCVYDPSRSLGKKWRVVTWNDVTHLR